MSPPRYCLAVEEELGPASAFDRTTLSADHRTTEIAGPIIDSWRSLAAQAPYEIPRIG